MLKQVMGTYIPSAFSICLNMLPQNFSIRDATFVHEYIHFLQDLLLPYCIRENLVFTNNLAWISKEAESSQKLERPFRKWSEECLLTNKQTTYTWGSGSPVVESKEIIDIQSDFFTSIYGHDIYEYFLIFEDSTKYQFGARDFLEYLAHKIENQFWETNAPDLPYRTVDIVFDFYSISFIPEAVRLLIVEYCLYNDNPVRFFINVFINQELIKNNKDKFLDYDVCMRFLFSLGWQSKGGFNESILSKTERRLNDFCVTLTMLYPHRQFESIKEWIIKTNNFCKEELSNKFIISSLYNMSKCNLDSFIERMLSKIGIPVLKFADNTVTSDLLPAQYIPDQFLEFYIVNEFVTWICSDSEVCPIYDICYKNYGLCELICKTDPVSYHGDCKFNFFLKSYKFDKLKIECL